MRASGQKGWGLVGPVPPAAIDLPLETTATEAQNVVFFGGAISVRRDFLRKGNGKCFEEEEGL